MLSSLPKTEFTDDLEKLLRDCYAPGKKFGDAFAQMMNALIVELGLILVDPLDAELKKLAAPLYAEAARPAPEIAAAIVARSRDLRTPAITRRSRREFLFRHSRTTKTARRA